MSRRASHARAPISRCTCRARLPVFAKVLCQTVDRPQAIALPEHLVDGRASRVSLELGVALRRCASSSRAPSCWPTSIHRHTQRQLPQRRSDRRRGAQDPALTPSRPHRPLFNRGRARPRPMSEGSTYIKQQYVLSYGRITTVPKCG